MWSLRVASTSRIGPLLAGSADRAGLRRPQAVDALLREREEVVEVRAAESGVRSAVAWTSTRPPSPVMTTFASTSAVESSA